MGGGEKENDREPASVRGRDLHTQRERERLRESERERERDYLLHESGQKLLFIKQLLQD